MSAQADIAPPHDSDAARAASATPLRAISFGDPAVSIERNSDGTIYLRPKTTLGDYPARITDRLHHWASAAPDRVFMAERDRGRSWRHTDLQRTPDREPPYRVGVARARALRREARRHPLRQLDRPCAGRVRRALCGHSVLSGVAGLFACLKRLRQAFLPDEASDARPRLRRRCRQIRRRACRQRARGDRNRRRLWRRARTRRDVARRSDGDAAASRARRHA